MAPIPTQQSLTEKTDQTVRAGVVEFIDLHTADPAELERLLQQWRSTALASEHVARAEVARDDADRGHLVLQIEYEPKFAEPAPCASTSPEAGLVAALLDRPPRFRTPIST